VVGGEEDDEDGGADEEEFWYWRQWPVADEELGGEDEWEVSEVHPV
jgi:hypothetical protein